MSDHKLTMLNFIQTCVQGVADPGSFRGPEAALLLDSKLSKSMTLDFQKNRMKVSVSVQDVPEDLVEGWWYWIKAAAIRPDPVVAQYGLSGSGVGRWYLGPEMHIHGEDIKVLGLVREPSGTVVTDYY